MLYDTTHADVYTDILCGVLLILLIRLFVLVLLFFCWLLILVWRIIYNGVVVVTILVTCALTNASHFQSK